MEHGGNITKERILEIQRKNRFSSEKESSWERIE